jgi:hypothetical protein
MHWALQLAEDFLHHFLTPSYPKGNFLPFSLYCPVNFSLTELAICGKEAVNKLQNAAKDIINLSPGLDSSLELDQIIEQAYISLLASRAADQFQWRRLYSDASVLCSLMDLTSPQALSEEIAMSCVARLDHALIIAGAPGQGVQTLIHDLILRTQAEHLPRRPFQSNFKSANRPTRSPPTHSSVLPSSFETIPRLIDPPSLSVFCRELLDKPFILTGFASDWPAMNERPWHSTDYLRSVAGRGRVVPVEVGKDYRTDDWAQRMMSWDDFLHVLEDPSRSQTILYLAQHNLLSQFPALREDILIPDYVFTAPQAPATCPFYRPPNNEEELVLNAWLGPAGTVSPAHTVCLILMSSSELVPQRGAQDPFFNLYGKRPFPSIPARSPALRAFRRLYSQSSGCRS